MNWYLGVLKKYAVFSGRARRKEYWMFFLINFLISLALIVVEGLLEGPGIVYLIYSLALLLPSIAVSIRRLHDIDRTGWWILINFIPIIGILVILYFAVLEGTPGPNRFGANPKEA